MPIKIASHLYRNRHGTFYFRLVVPSDLRDRIGRTEVRLTLATEQRQQATISTLALILGLPELWAGLRFMSQIDEPIPADYFKLWKLQMLENARLKVQIVGLREELEDRELQLGRSVTRQRAREVVTTAFTTGQLKGKQELEKNLVFPWPPERTVEFSVLADAYMAHFGYRAAGGRKKPPGAKTLEGYTKDIAMFVAVMGDMNIGAIDRDVAGKYFNILRRLPANMSRVGKYRGKSVQQVLAMKPIPQSEYNASKKMERVSGMFRWALEEMSKWGINTNPFKGYGQSGDRSTLRRPFSKEELKKLLSEQAFVSRSFPTTYAYWLIPMALFTGARLGELCQLDLKDFVDVDGVPCIDINDIEAHETVVGDTGRKKRVKTKNAKRLVPIHPELVRLGLLRHVDRLRAQGGRHLFPDLSRSRRDGPAHAASNWFQRFRERAGVSGKQATVFHSFRHFFITTLLDNDVSPHTVAPIVGHEAELITGQVYWNKRDASKRQPTVNAFELPADLMALIPAVENVTFTRARGRRPQGLEPRRLVPTLPGHAAGVQEKRG